MKKIINGKAVVITEEEKNALQNEVADFINTAEYKSIRINELKQKLSDTDYIACKIAEGVATADEYAEMISQRQQWRNKINELERSRSI